MHVESPAWPWSMQRLLRTRESTMVSTLPGQEWLYSALGGLNAGVIVSDLDGRVQYLNQRAERLLGASSAAAIGSQADALLDGLASVTSNFRTSKSPLIDPTGGVIGRIDIFESAKDAAEAQLSESEERFRLLIENVRDYAIFMLDPDGTIASWNLGAERIKGYKANEIIGKHFSIFYRKESVAAAWPDEELRRAAIDGRFEDEGWRVRKDGSEFWANVIITALLDKDGQLRGFSKITRDLTDRRKLERAQLEAELQTDLNRKKDEFLAMLSHELRNPLAPIVSAAQLLKMQPGSEEARSIIERQSQHLTRLVEDLLDVSRITTGRIQLKLEVLDLREIAQHALQAALDAASEKEMKLSIETPPYPVPVNVDATRMQQVLGNLFTNAIKYGNQGSTAHVKVSRSDSTGVVSIKDDGIGIDPKLLPHIFDLFTQGELSLDRSEGGMGIGLTVVKNVVQLLGGEVGARSEGIGKGSEFSICLPLAPLPVSSDDGTAPETSADSKRVLLVDDNKDAADILALLLEAHGHTVHVVYDGEAALEAASRLRPDVVFLDLGLPTLDGFDVAKRLRANADLNPIRIIALSGYGQPSDFERTKESGFDAHLVKPVTSKTMIEAMKQTPLTRPLA